MKKFIIVGAGGFGREVYNWLLDSYSDDLIKGFLSPNKNDLNNTGIIKPILGDEQNYNINENDRFILAIGDPNLRFKISNTILEKGGIFESFIHPTAIVSKSAQIKNGTIICPFCIVGPQSIVGSFSLLNFYSSIAHDSILGSYSILSPYSTINGCSSVGDFSFLSTGVSIAPKIKIGSKVRISAGCAITTNIPDNTLIPPLQYKVYRGIV